MPLFHLTLLSFLTSSKSYKHIKIELNTENIPCPGQKCSLAWRQEERNANARLMSLLVKLWLFKCLISSEFFLNYEISKSMEREERIPKTALILNLKAS